MFAVESEFSSEFEAKLPAVVDPQWRPRPNSVRSTGGYDHCATPWGLVGLQWGLTSRSYVGKRGARGNRNGEKGRQVGIHSAPHCCLAAMWGWKRDETGWAEDSSRPIRPQSREIFSRIAGKCGGDTTVSTGSPAALNYSAVRVRLVIRLSVAKSFSSSSSKRAPLGR